MENQTTERPAFLVELLGEIDAMDGGLFPPRSKRDGEEAIIGEVTGWPRKVYALAQMYGREEARLRVDCQYDEGANLELCARHSFMHAKHELLMDLFWLTARESLDAFGKCDTVGIRENWQLVESKNRKPDFRNFMQKLFEG